jgi:hypothetical protein
MKKIFILLFILFSIVLLTVPVWAQNPWRRLKVSEENFLFKRHCSKSEHVGVKLTEEANLLSEGFSFSPSR